MKHQDKQNTKVDFCSPGTQAASLQAGSSGPSAAGPQLLSESFQSSEFGEPAFRQVSESFQRASFRRGFGELAFREVLESFQKSHLSDIPILVTAVGIYWRAQGNVG